MKMYGVCRARGRCYPFQRPGRPYWIRKAETALDRIAGCRGSAGDALDRRRRIAVARVPVDPEAVIRREARRELARDQLDATAMRRIVMRNQDEPHPISA